jgi:hypothetical protein
MRRRFDMKVAAGVGLCLTLALIVGVVSTWTVSVAPLHLKKRYLTMSSGSTSMLVDSPTTSILDPTQDTYSYESLQARAVLLGNIVANDPVRSGIARRAGVDPGALRIVPPATVNQPHPMLPRGQEPKITDIVRTTNQYRIELDVAPSVPVVDVYALAPDVVTARRLADATVAAARAYVDRTTAASTTPADARLRIRALGAARGTIVNDHVHRQVAATAFLLTLAASAALLLALSRVRRGWRLAVLDERAEAAAAGGGGS